MEPSITPRCGVAEQLGDGSATLKLGTNRPLFLIRDRLPNFTASDIAAWVEEAHARWGRVCDWKARRILDLSEAQVTDFVSLITVADLGLGGVLADQELPYGDGSVLRMRISNRVTWKPTDGPMRAGIDPVRTICHEIGHFMGISHLPPSPPPDLMEPRILDGVIGPQEAEARIARGWFGEPVASPPRPPSPYRLILESDAPIQVVS